MNNPRENDGLVWRLGYYEGITWEDWNKGYYIQSPNHGNGAKDPNWVWTDTYCYEDHWVVTNEEVTKAGVPEGIVWAVVRGPRPETGGIMKGAKPELEYFKDLQEEVEAWQ